MPKCYLKTYNTTPPGGFPFSDTDGQKFKSLPVIEDVAKLVASYRASNKLPRANFLDAINDVDNFTCQRLGNMVQWCSCNDQGSNMSRAITTHQQSGCKSCGAKI